MKNKQSKRKPPGYWTAERVMENAAQYSTIKEWREAEGKGPEIAASRLGIRDEATAHMTKARHGYWTDDLLKAEAKLFSSRVDWQRLSNSSYQIARRRGKKFLDECCAHMNVDGMTRKPNKHRREALLEAAKPFKTRHEWELGDRLTYVAARYRGPEFLDECCAHMTERFRWTRELCLEVTASLRNVAEWQRVSNGSYKAAVENGWYEECSAHFEENLYGTDADVIYIWQITGTNTYKIGLTSQKMGEFRIWQCSRHNGMDANIILLAGVDDARDIEQALLTLGEATDFGPEVDGYTEFRVLSDADLLEATRLIYDAALPKPRCLLAA